MSQRLRTTVGVVAAVLCSACYHATIKTGLPSGNDVVSKAWANGFLWGLIPPETVETASQCKNGAAIVETQHSFLNMLAQFVTAGIYTPMQIDVTCASSNRMSLAPGDQGDVIRAKAATPDGLRAALVDAAELSARTHHSVLVQF